MNQDLDLAAMLQVLGREIRAERTRRAWSREQLAELADVSAKQVGKIERGQAGQMVETWRIAQALGVNLSAMVDAAEREVRKQTA